MYFLKTLIVTLLTSTLAVSLHAAPSSYSKAKPTSKLGSVERKIEAESYQDAINDLLVIVASDSKNADVYNLLGFSHRKLKRYEEAEQYYEQALFIDPKHKGAMEYLGELYVETDRIQAAKLMLSMIDSVCFFKCREYEQLEKIIEEYDMVDHVVF